MKNLTLTAYGLLALVLGGTLQAGGDGAAGAPAPGREKFFTNVLTAAYPNLNDITGADVAAKNTTITDLTKTYCDRLGNEARLALAQEINDMLQPVRAALGDVENKTPGKAGKAAPDGAAIVAALAGINGLEPFQNLIIAYDAIENKGMFAGKLDKGFDYRHVRAQLVAALREQAQHRANLAAEEEARRVELQHLYKQLAAEEEERQRQAAEEEAERRRQQAAEAERRRQERRDAQRQARAEEFAREMQPVIEEFLESIENTKNISTLEVPAALRPGTKGGRLLQPALDDAIKYYRDRYQRDGAKDDLAIMRRFQHFVVETPLVENPIGYEDDEYEDDENYVAPEPDSELAKNISKALWHLDTGSDIPAALLTDLLSKENEIAFQHALHEKMQSFLDKADQSPTAGERFERYMAFAKSRALLTGFVVEWEAAQTAEEVSGVLNDVWNFHDVQSGTLERLLANANTKADLENGLAADIDHLLQSLDTDPEDEQSSQRLEHLRAFARKHGLKVEEGSVSRTPSDRSHAGDEGGESHEGSDAGSHAGSEHGAEDVAAKLLKFAQRLRVLQQRFAALNHGGARRK